MPRRQTEGPGLILLSAPLGKLWTHVLMTISFFFFFPFYHCPPLSLALPLPNPDIPRFEEFCLRQWHLLVFSERGTTFDFNFFFSFSPSLLYRTLPTLHGPFHFLFPFRLKLVAQGEAAFVFGGSVKVDLFQFWALDADFFISFLSFSARSFYGLWEGVVKFPYHSIC